MGANLAVVRENSFLRKQQHELAKPLKLIGKEIEGIIERLVTLSMSKDEKVAAGALKTLLDYYKDCADLKSKDELTRLIAQSRLGGGLGGSSVPEDNRPQICFDTIQDV